MVVPSPRAPFIDAAAVEAWDAWFRWRDDELHDLSIEDTWWRVAATLASAEAEPEVCRWRSRFNRALSSWKLLPDERLLATAGTGRIGWASGPLHACLNAAAFVPPLATYDPAEVADCAALAVRALDNAAVLARLPATHLRIGLVGLAGALYLLGLRYDSDEGRALAASLARALAEGCRRANAQLALERGVGAGGGAEALPREKRAGMSAILPCGRAVGQRHATLASVSSQPRLALFANSVADALDPLMGVGHAYVFVAPGGQRKVLSSGYAFTLLGKARATEGDETLGRIGWEPQLRMRAAVQAFMDEPVDYPVLVARFPDDDERRQAERLAGALGLARPEWRVPAGLSSPSVRSGAVHV